MSTDAPRIVAVQYLVKHEDDDTTVLRVTTGNPDQSVFDLVLPGKLYQRQPIDGPVDAMARAMTLVVANQYLRKLRGLGWDVVRKDSEDE